MTSSRNIQWLALICLLIASNTGCHLIHPPKVPPPMDPLPEMYHQEPSRELPVAVQDQIEDMEVQIGALMRQMKQLETEVSERQHDLVNTRRLYDEALHEIQLMREEISFWGSSLQRFQERLAERDDQRMQMYDELSEGISELVMKYQSP